MMRKLAVLAVGLALCAAVAVTAADGPDKTKIGKPSVEATAVTVNRKLDNKNFPFSGGSVSLSALVKCPGREILAVDSSSKLTQFGDDKNTDFLKSAGFFKPTLQQGMLAKNRSGVVVTVTVFNTSPAKGASKLVLKGEAVLVCGTEEKTSEEKEVEIKTNSETKFGDFTVKVNTEKGFVPGSGGSFSITASKPTFKSVTVKDADGKTINVTPGYYFAPGGFSKIYTNSFNLPKQVSKVKVAITYFSKEEKVTVPVDLAVGIGL